MTASTASNNPVFPDFETWAASVERKDRIWVFYYHTRLMWWDDVVVAPVPGVAREFGPRAMNTYRVSKTKLSLLPEQLLVERHREMIRRLGSMGERATIGLVPGGEVVGNAYRVRELRRADGPVIHLQTHVARHLAVADTELFINDGGTFVVAKREEEVMAAAAVFQVWRD